MKELRHFCLFLAVLICSLQYSVGIDAPENVLYRYNSMKESTRRNVTRYQELKHPEIK